MIISILDLTAQAGEGKCVHFLNFPPTANEVSMLQYSLAGNLKSVHSEGFETAAANQIR